MRELRVRASMCTSEWYAHAYKLYASGVFLCFYLLVKVTLYFTLSETALHFDYSIIDHIWSIINYNKIIGRRLQTELVLIPRSPEKMLIENILY